MPEPDAPSEKTLVTCQECGSVKTALAAHLRIKHKMSVLEYRMKWTKDGTGNDVSIGYVIKQSSPGERHQLDGNNKSKAQRFTEKKLGPIAEGLSPEEMDFYADRYNTLFMQAEQDESAESTISTVVLNEIKIRRLQKELMRRAADVSKEEDRHNQVTDLVRTNGTLLKDLNLTRAQKEKQKKSVQTTPSRFAAAIERYFQINTPEQIAKQNEEMQEANARLQKRLVELKALSNPIGETEHGHMDSLADTVAVPE